MHAPQSVVTVRTVDYHTAGEPFRIVAHDVPELPGETVAQRRIAAMNSTESERVRRMLCHEPRGHADMYGGFIVPADDDAADFGVLFWHKDGYSTACGHGTIALGVWAVHTGRVAADPDGEIVVTIDVPSGRVRARVRSSGGAVESVTFENVPSRVLKRGIPVATSLGVVAVDLAYAGAIYASVDAAGLGLSVTPDSLPRLIEVGREIKWALNEHEAARHDDDRLSGVYGTILHQELDPTASGPHQRNVTVFADGEVDRSPCGSGTGARLALLADEGRLGVDDVLTHESIVGTVFLGRARTRAGGEIVPEVESMAYRTGESVFTLDPNDPLGTGFVLR